MQTLNYNFILDADSYKLSHPKMLPKGTRGVFSYVTAREKEEVIVMFGLQIYLKRYLSNPITMVMIDEAEKFAKLHGEPFFRTDWEYILNRYNGYIPVKIRAIPEGQRLVTAPLEGKQIPLATVECVDDRVCWLAQYIETQVQRAIWYPTTIVSNDFKFYKMLKQFYDQHSDNPGMLSFSEHDFGGRGVTCYEQSEIGGASHGVYFMGSDTMAGVRALNHFYACKMSAFSVIASEHFVQTAYGPNGQREYIKTVLDEYAKPGAIVSIVLDAYDVIRESKLLATEFKDQIIASGAKIVFRPDSGDMFKNVSEILKIQEDSFGFKLNSKGKKVINNVGIIQGDGVDIETAKLMMRMVVGMGYAPESVIFGSGGALLQKVNRDTYRFAQKASAVLIGDTWVDIFKNPVNDSGKRSDAGRLDHPDMVDVFDTGVLLKDWTLEEIRERATNNT